MIVAGRCGAVRRTAVVGLALVATVTAGCGGASSPTTSRKAPDLQAFLRLPVATPSACAGAVAGSTAGRRSPWVGTVDVSVFLEATATQAQVRELGRQLAALEGVRRVYFESAADAYAEFARLYTCSADVDRSQIPASYRLVLAALKRPDRDALVSRIRGLPGVKSVSCDPTSPCLPQS
jgi:hypothetical protein